MYIEQLKSGVPTERGVRLSFSSGNKEKTIEFSREAAGQILQALQVPTKTGTPEERFTLTVLGHQVVQSPEAKGLLLRTKEWGIIVFSLPQSILPKLIADLRYLASCPSASADVRGRFLATKHWPRSRLTLASNTPRLSLAQESQSISTFKTQIGKLTFENGYPSD